MQYSKSIVAVQYRLGFWRPFWVTAQVSFLTEKCGKATPARVLLTLPKVSKAWRAAAMSFACPKFRQPMFPTSAAPFRGPHNDNDYL